MMQALGKSMLAMLLVGIFLVGLFASDSSARRSRLASSARTLSKMTVVKAPPSDIRAAFRNAGGAAVGTVIGELGYDAFKSSDEQAKTPTEGWPLMQRSASQDGGCGCRGN